MRFSKTLMAAAAVMALSTGAVMAAEGSTNTDGTHNANNTQTDTNMGAGANAKSSNDAAADVNANASTEAEMSDTSNDIDTSADVNVNTNNSTSATTGGLVGGVTGAVTNTTTAVTGNLSTSTVKDAQAALKGAGHPVSVDGVWGAKSTSALREFQQANGLDVTGTLNTETLTALNVAR